MPMVEALSPYLPKELIYCVIEYVCLDSLVALKEHGLQVAKFLFHHEQNQFRSLDMIWSLTDQIVLRGATSGSVNLVELDWILEEAIQLQQAFKIPYLNYPFSVIAYNGTLEQFKHIEGKLKKETRVQMCLSTNILHWAVSSKNVALVDHILGCSIPLISGDYPALTVDHLWDAIRSDSIPMAEYVLSYLIKKSTLIRLTEPKRFVRSSAMNKWIVKTLKTKVLDLDVEELIFDYGHMAKRGRLDDLKIMAGTMPLTFSKYLHNVLSPSENRCAIFRQRSRNRNELIVRLPEVLRNYSNWSEDSISLLLSILLKDMDKAAYLLEYGISEASSIVFSLACHEGMVQEFQFMLLGFESSDEEMINQHVEPIFIEGHLELAKILIQSCRLCRTYLIEHVRTAIRYDHSSILDYFLSEVHIEPFQCQRLLRQALCKDAFKCLQVLKTHHLKDPNYLKWDIEVYQNLSCISVEVIQWMWMNGFDDLVRKLDNFDFLRKHLGFSNKKGTDMRLCSFLVKTLGLDHFNRLLKKHDCYLSTIEKACNNMMCDSVDLMEHRITHLNEKITQVPPKLFKRFYRDLCPCDHGVTLDFIQWLVSRGFLNLLDLTKCKGLIEKCESTKGKSCALKFLMLKGDPRHLVSGFHL